MAIFMNPQSLGFICADTATLAPSSAPYHTEARTFARRKVPMLWTIFVVLLVLWLLGFVGFHVLGAYIHILLLIALVVLILQLVGGRRTVV
jgi:Family of unknown function (DUF5670)